MSLGPGDQAPELVHDPVTRTDIVRYAGAGGDFNPIHHDEPFAASLGLPSVFAMGLYQGGILSSFASSWLGLINLRRFELRFAARVWPGETLRCSGVVTSAEDVDGERVVEVDLSVTNADTGEVKVTGRATAAARSTGGDR
jgi:acyl dehydratase